MGEKIFCRNELENFQAGVGRKFVSPQTEALGVSYKKAGIIFLHPEQHLEVKRMIILINVYKF